ncbi:hypothetical protein D3C85_1406680 [compost metagenome]
MRDEAEVVAAGGGVHAGEPRHGVFAHRAQVDLLLAELHRYPRARARREILALHAEHLLVPGGAGFHVFHVEDEMVEAVDVQRHVGSLSKGAG